MNGIRISTRPDANASDKPRSGDIFVENPQPPTYFPASAAGAPAGSGVSPKRIAKSANLCNAAQSQRLMPVIFAGVGKKLRGLVLVLSACIHKPRSTVPVWDAWNQHCAQ